MTQPYAVLFKLYYWDDMVARRLAELCASCGSGEVWAVVDDTNGYVDGVAHPRVFRTEEADLRALGLTTLPYRNANWFNVDYQMLAFHAACPDYAYYVMVEYDCSVRHDFDRTINRIEADEVDFAATPISTPIDEWGWVGTLEALWPRGQIVKALLTVSVFSARAVVHLGAARRELARRHAAGEIAIWPFCEGYVPSVLRDAGFRSENLTRYGSTLCLDWWPPYHETELPALARQDFIHPVLDGPRFVASMLRHSEPEAWFEPGSQVRRKLDLVAPALVVPALVAALAAKRSVVGLVALRQAVDDLCWPEADFDLDAVVRGFAEPGKAIDLAVGCEASQSSVSPWSRKPTPSADAIGAVRGAVTGDYTFHTGYELLPWWAVDLGRPCLVEALWLHNRLTAERDRVRAISIWGSPNGRGWRLLHRRAEMMGFGGADGRPLVVKLPERLVLRFVRIELDGTDFLHLDAVQVFGTRLGVP